MLTFVLELLHEFEPLAFYLATIAVFFVSALRLPQIGLYYLAFFLPLVNTRYVLHAYPFGEKFVDFVLLGVLIGILSRRGGTEWTPTPLTAFLAVWAVMLYASLWRGSFYLNSDWPISHKETRVSDWKNYVEFFFFFLASTSALRTRRQIAGLLITMAVCFFMVNRAYYGTMSGRDLSSFSYDVRDAGPLGGAGENGLAAFEATCLLFLTAILGMKLKRIYKLAILGLMVTGVYSLLFTFSRGGYLAFVSGLLFLGVVNQRKLLIVVAVLIVSWQALLPVSVQQRITMTYDQSDSDGTLDASAQTRVDLWTDAKALIAASPVFGTGFQTYRYMGRMEDLKDTHNYYVKILVETGAIGLLMFLYLLWRMFALGYRLYRQSEDPFLASVGLGFSALMVGMLLANVFGDRWSYFQVDGWMWMLLGAVVRGLILTEEPQESSEEAVAAEIAEPEGVLVQELPHGDTFSA
jgi:putative inorganic carbon (hco3(-)) transporter